MKKKGVKGAEMEAKKEVASEKKELSFWQGYGNPKLFGMRLGAMLLSALILPLTSAPFSLWYLHWVYWIPMIWAILAQDGRGRGWLALLGGTIANYLIFYWIINLLPNFTNIPIAVSLLLNLLLCMGLSVLWILLALILPYLKRVFPRGWIFLFPAYLVVIEFFMPQLFPYMQGSTQSQVTSIIQLTSLTGIYGVSYLLFWSNATLYATLEAFFRGERWFTKRLIVFIGTVLLIVGYGSYRKRLYRAALPKAKRLTVGMIQAHLRPRDHRRLGFNQVTELYIKMSKEAVKRGADWIVWSEGEFKWPLSYKPAQVILRAAAKEIGRPLLVGGIDILRDKKRGYRFFNSAVYVTPDGFISKRYDKHVLVPFGEYMPYEKLLSPIYRKINWNSRYIAGKGPLILRLDGIPFGFLICYEAIFPHYVRRVAQAGAHLLVNITYDTWFGKTTASYQHLMLAAIRSAELGIPLIRLATSGVSTTADALGRMSKLSPLFERKVVIRHLALVYLPTLYTQIGDLFAWLCVLLVLGSIIYFFLFNRRERKEGNPS